MQRQGISAACGIIPFLKTKAAHAHHHHQTGQALLKATGCRNVYERCDPLMRKGEGLSVTPGALAGDQPPKRVMVRDGNRLAPMDIRTGFTYPR
jgi:predicted nucleotidyltransferase